MPARPVVFSGILNGLARRFAKRPLFISAFMLVCCGLLLANGCLSGSPEEQNQQSGVEIVVTPDVGGELVSDDQRVLVTFEPGTVSRPTTFSISRIPSDNYPDQYMLQSDVYQIEPSRTLEKDILITFDMNGLEGKGFTLSQLYTQNALTLRELLPGESASYLAVQETTIEDYNGSPHRVLRHTTKTPGAIGLYVHDCYVMCRKSVECASWLDDPQLTPKQEIARCMETYGCPADLEKMNSALAQAQLSCALTHTCSEAFGCCLEEPPACGDSPDGDTPDGDTPDGDTPDGDTPDGDTPDGDSDGDEDGDSDGDTPDGDQPDGDEPTFDVKTCVAADNCTPDACAFDARVSNDSGYCMALNGDPIQSYTYQTPGGYTEIPGATPILDCAGLEPQTNTVGPAYFDLLVKLENWWLVQNPEGINVSIYYEWNLDAAIQTFTLDSDGQASLQDVSLTDEWFVVKMWRDSDDVMQRIVPTYIWGNYITKDEAKTAELNAQPVTMTIMPVDANRYKTFAQALGFSEGIPAGFAMVLGQVNDCRSNTPYILSNISIGFKELQPLEMGYFDTQLDYPTPSDSRVGTNKNGLFVGVYLPPSNVLTAFAFGKLRVGETEADTLVGLTPEGHIQVLQDSVAIIRFNRFH